MSPPVTLPEARALVLDVLGEVAPDLEAGTLDPDARLQDDLDLDSMDFLNFVAGLSDRTGLEVPERDYARLATVNACVDYLIAGRAER
jgi:acyl carrier protein